MLGWYIFLYLFTFNVCAYLHLKWVSCKEHILASCLLIHSDNLCIWIGTLRPLMFNVIIDVFPQYYSSWNNIHHVLLFFVYSLNIIHHGIIPTISITVFYLSLLFCAYIFAFHFFSFFVVLIYMISFSLLS